MPPMRKLIAAMNMTLDGNCDHREGIADEEIHRYYTDMLRGAGALIYGRITYQLMESYWPLLVKEPSGDATFDDFAQAIDDVEKVVFSKSLTGAAWRNSQLVRGDVEAFINELKSKPGRDIYVGSRSMIIQSLNLGLLDELQIVVHPIVVGSGMQLFTDVQKRVELKLLHTRTFECGAVLMHYKTP